MHFSPDNEQLDVKIIPLTWCFCDRNKKLVGRCQQIYDNWASDNNLDSRVPPLSRTSSHHSNFVIFPNFYTTKSPFSDSNSGASSPQTVISRRAPAPAPRRLGVRSRSAAPPGHDRRARARSQQRCRPRSSSPPLWGQRYTEWRERVECNAWQATDCIHWVFIGH